MYRSCNTLNLYYEYVILCAENVSGTFSVKNYSNYAMKFKYLKSNNFIFLREREGIQPNYVMYGVNSINYNVEFNPH